MPTAHLADARDARVVGRALSGDQDAFEELIARYQRRAFAIALGVGVRHDSVPDVLQDAFLRAFRALPGLEERASFGSWFLSIVRNVARRSLRDSRRVTVPPDVERVEESHADGLERSDFNDRLWREVDRLPAGIREAIFLYYYEGESVRRVAATLGTTTSAVKNRLQKGRDLLRERLWRELRDSLRDMLPSTRQWRCAARRLSLVVLTSLPATWYSTAASATAAAPTSAALSSITAPLQGILLMSAKQITVSIVACAVLFWIGFTLGNSGTPPVSTTPITADPAVTASPPITNEPPPASDPVDAAPVDAPEPEVVDVAPVEPPADPPQLGSVRAHVVRESDDAPMPGVIVSVRHRDTSPRLEAFLGLTDEHGIARIDDVPPGRIEVFADRSRGRDRRRSWAEVVAGETVEVLLSLRQGITVDGIVVDAGGMPVAGADVRVSETDFDGLHGHIVTRSADDGTFRIEGVESGRYISARAEGWAPSSQHAFFAEPGSTVPLRLVLPGPGGAVAGRVVDGSGAPVPRAAVMIGSRDIPHGSYAVRAAPVTTWTDAEGAFEATGIPPGPTPIVARARGFGPAEVTVDVVAPGTAQAILTLAAGVQIEGTVFGPHGAPARSAIVVAGVGLQEPRRLMEPDDLLVTRTRTDEHGAYRLEGLAAGSITVAVSASGLGKARETVDAAPGDVLALDVQLGGSLKIAGRVVLEDGTPVERWGVHGVGLTYQFTDADGRFEFRDLDDQAYVISVTEEGHRIRCAHIEGVVPGGEDLVITVRDADRSRSFITGTIVDPDGRRVRGARIQCYRPDPPAGLRAKSGFFGGFRVGPVPAGTYRLGAQTDELPMVWTDDITVQHGETLSVGQVRLRRPGFVAFAFRSREGRTPEGLYLGVRDPDDRYSFAVTLSSEPDHRAPLVPGKHTAILRGDDFESAHDFEIEEGEETVVEIDLDAAAGERP